MARSLPLVLAVLLASPLAAEVVESDAGGFVSRHEHTLSATAADAYAALVEVERWWDASHSYSLKAENFSLEARAGGCFCERLEDGGAVEHMRVVFVQPQRMIRMRGGLGPLQSHAVTGSLTWSIAPADEGSTLTVEYNVGGWVTGGLAAWAGPVDGVIGGQAARLARYVESGSPDASGGQD